MALNSKLSGDIPGGSGNLDGLAAGTITGGSTLSMQNVERGTLSAHFVVDAETDTIQIEALWQVSTDNGTTWREVIPSWVLATGTAGADASVELTFSAPDATYNCLHVRAAVRNQVAVGTTSDTWSIVYRYVRKDLV